MLEGYVKAAELLSNTLREKAAQYQNAPKLGRTHLQDPDTPITIGQKLNA